ncbi:hypothetical protein CYLTODRAFT_418785 [Cylindrobasidium torrendii FP15055 ss-10]|uniref:Mitochondrial K+-H+ exchange-related-domain-containing protein n=1 Tax=Cylindrobasidium torrendii FP15055 ss-10 TaxID=1314674 RepID=A0A0D7BM62_9AGAR|nr:hypothetical protein CYLTODRAFT_418785 [Cylindrobasidium torrendii FP15055 ss-10]
MVRPPMLRIIAVPLRRAAPSASVPLKSLPRIMTYYHFQLNQALPVSHTKGWSARALSHWAQNKAGDIWAGFGKSKDGSWQLKLFQWGERMVDRIDFEELALQSVDPSLGPSLTDLAAKLEDKTKPVTIPLLYAPSVISADSIAAQLKALVEYRIPKHKKRFWIYAVAAPFTAPFMVIPVVPNIPFFFCVWRAWSNYRAYRASEYLQALLLDNKIVAESDGKLDNIYHRYLPKALPPPESKSSQEEPKPPFNDQLLLTRDAIPVIRETFELDSSAEGEMYRALEQARVRPDPHSQSA